MLKLLVGLAIAGILYIAVNGAEIALNWGKPAVPFLSLNEVVDILLLLIGIMVVEGFPEELLFRGYVFQNLNRNLPGWATYLITVLIFWTLHFITAVRHLDGFFRPETVAFLAAVLAFSLLLTALRMRSGSIWMGVGLHTGLDWSLNMNGLLVVPKSTLNVNSFTIDQFVLFTIGLLVITGFVLGIRGGSDTPGSGLGPGISSAVISG
ncbi:MAG: lysostaphin resistance A-like protein [Candidatus Dormibacteraceae bacterium]